MKYLKVIHVLLNAMTTDDDDIIKTSQEPN